MTTPHTHNNGFLRGARACLSISFAGAVFGFVFGVLTHTKQLSAVTATLMSAVVYAGAAQMISISMWSNQHIATWALAGICFIVCLRYILMGIAIHPKLHGMKGIRPYIALFFMADENWALTLIEAHRKPDNPAYLYAYLLGSGVMFYSAWVISTLLGNLVARNIPDPKAFGFDFAFTAIFLALLVVMWRDKKDFWPWLVAAVFSIITAQFIPGNWYIIVGAIAGSAFGAWREYH